MPGNPVHCPADCPVPGSALSAGKILTAYWDIRGLGQPIRLVLEYVGADFDDVRIDAGPGEPGGGEPGGPGSGYKGHWMVGAKPDLGINFANVSGDLPTVMLTRRRLLPLWQQLSIQAIYGHKNGRRSPRWTRMVRSAPTKTIAACLQLPYMIDGDTKIVQSTAILRHLGRKFNLMGSTPDELTMQDMLLDQVRGIRPPPHHRAMCLAALSCHFPRLPLPPPTSPREQAADFDNGFTGLCYGGWADEKRKADYVAKLPAALAMWGVALGAKLYLVCGSPTVVDFKFAETLDKIKIAFGPPPPPPPPPLMQYGAADDVLLCCCCCCWAAARYLLLRALILAARLSLPDSV